MGLLKLHRIGIVGGRAEALVRHDLPWVAARTPEAAFPALWRALAWNHRLAGAAAALAIGAERLLRPWLKIWNLLWADENILLNAGGALELTFPFLLKEYPGLPPGSSKNLADAAEGKTAPAAFSAPPKILSGAQSCATPGEGEGLAFGSLWPLLILRPYAANSAALSFFGSAPKEPFGGRAISPERGLGVSLRNLGSHIPEGESSMPSGAGYDETLQFQSQQESPGKYSPYSSLDEITLVIPPQFSSAILTAEPPSSGQIGSNRSSPPLEGSSASPIPFWRRFSESATDRPGAAPISWRPNIFIQTPTMTLSRRPAKWAKVYEEAPGLPPQKTGTVTFPAGSFDPPKQKSSDSSVFPRESTLGVHIRTRLERFFPNLDLTTIRVHSDESADRAARSLRADAFTIGRSIFFRSGRFDPASPRGLALLGHELVHVQQAEQRDSQMLPPDQGKLEKEALSTERIFASVFSADQGSAEGTVALPLRQGALPLPLVHTAGAVNPSSPRPSREIPFSPSPPPPGGMAEASFPSGSLQPQRADEGRASAREPSPASGSGGGAATDDIENLSRRLLRTISRQIAVEKERRGVDRWAR